MSALYRRHRSSVGNIAKRRCNYRRMNARCFLSSAKKAMIAPLPTITTQPTHKYIPDLNDTDQPQWTAGTMMKKENAIE